MCLRILPQQEPPAWMLVKGDVLRICSKFHSERGCRARGAAARLSASDAPLTSPRLCDHSREALSLPSGKISRRSSK